MIKSKNIKLGEKLKAMGFNCPPACSSNWYNNKLYVSTS